MAETKPLTTYWMTETAMTVTLPLLVESQARRRGGRIDEFEGLAHSAQSAR